METNQENKIKAGVGMPAQLYLHEFGSKIWDAFGKPAYLVGSVLTSKSWRDVDIRLILDDKEYAEMFPGIHSGTGDEHHSAKWVALCLAWSAFGEKMTGLPIDFQIQQQSYANDKFDGPRSCIGITPARIKH